MDSHGLELIGNCSARPSPAEVGEQLDDPIFLQRPDIPGWLVWQLHGYALADGIAVGVDLDVMRASS